MGPTLSFFIIIPIGPGECQLLMKERHLLVLRPNQYNDGNLRLALFTDDYQKFVHGRHVQSLYVNFFAANRNISSIRTYVNHGSIVKKSIISNWLHNKGFSEGTLLLFELIKDDDAGIHIYNFLGTTADVTTLINNTTNKIL